ncbi:MAG: phosphatidylglycerophosphatase A [Gammaproteobacteria bacterium]|nr:phosphatidylglycerophosphatase A [Gammaproteobacteria bacterium]
MKPTKKIPLSYLKNPIHFLALGFGSGLSPKAPGTLGTVAVIPVYLLLSQLPLAYYIGLVVALSLLGIAICDYTSSKLEGHDHPAIVFDEFAGYLITMIAAPVSVFTVVAGFILFRLFDILKPWPISWFDKKVAGGLGIMLDDIVAGCISLLLLQLLIANEWVL